MAEDWSERDQLRAEHGFALLVTVYDKGHAANVLYDGGLGRDTAVHNLDVLQMRNSQDLWIDVSRDLLIIS